MGIFKWLKKYSPRAGEVVSGKRRVKFLQERSAGTGLEYYFNGDRKMLGGTSHLSPGEYPECKDCTKFQEIPDTWCGGTFNMCSSDRGPGCHFCQEGEKHLDKPRTLSYLGYGDGFFWFQQIQICSLPYTEDSLIEAFENEELEPLRGASVDIEELRSYPLSWD